MGSHFLLISDEWWICASFKTWGDFPLSLPGEMLLMTIKGYQMLFGSILSLVLDCVFYQFSFKLNSKIQTRHATGENSTRN